MAMRRNLPGWILLGAMLPAPLVASGAPPHASRHGTSVAKVQAQLQDFNDKLAAAHARNMSLQSEVADLEKQNAARSQQLQQRDDQIAALQKHLAAAGVPAAAASAGQ
jgi:septal ring factor EnvC (AmiA/AmiB activator)